MFVSFALQFDMDSKKAKLAKLNLELEHVKKRIAKYEKKDEEKELSDAEKMLLHDYLDKKKCLKEEIKALEGLL